MRREIRSTAFSTLRLVLLQLASIGKASTDEAADVVLPKGVLEVAMRELRFRTSEFLKLRPNSKQSKEKEELCFELLRLLYPVAAMSGITVATSAEDNRALCNLFSHPHSSSRIRRRVCDFWFSTRDKDRYLKLKMDVLFRAVERYTCVGVPFLCEDEDEKDTDEWFRVRVSDRGRNKISSSLKRKEIKKAWQWLDQNADWQNYDARTSALLERSAEALSMYVQAHMKTLTKTPRTVVEWGFTSVLSSVSMSDGRTCTFNLGLMKEKDMSTKKERLIRRVGPPGKAAAFLEYVEDQQSEVNSKQKHRLKFGTHKDDRASSTSSSSSHDTFLECVASVRSCSICLYVSFSHTYIYKLQAEAVRLLRMYHNENDNNKIVSQIIKERIDRLVTLTNKNSNISLLELSKHKNIIVRAVAAFHVAGSFKDPIYVGGSVRLRNCSKNMYVVGNERGTLLNRDGDFVEVGFEDRCERLHHSTILGTNTTISTIMTPRIMFDLLEWVLRHYLEVAHLHDNNTLYEIVPEKIIRAPVLRAPDLERFSTSISVSSTVSSKSPEHDEEVKETEKEKSSSLTQNHSVGFSLLVTILESMMSILEKQITTSMDARKELSERSDLMNMLFKIASAHSRSTGHPLPNLIAHNTDAIRSAALRVEESALELVTYTKIRKDSSFFTLSKVLEEEEENEEEEKEQNDEIFAPLPMICDSKMYFPYFEALKKIKEMEDRQEDDDKDGKEREDEDEEEEDDEKEPSASARSLSEMLQVDVSICEKVLQHVNNDMNEAGMLIVSHMEDLSGLIQSLIDEKDENDVDYNEDDDMDEEEEQEFTYQWHNGFAWSDYKDEDQETLKMAFSSGETTASLSPTYVSLSLSLFFFCKLRQQQQQQVRRHDNGF